MNDKDFLELEAKYYVEVERRNKEKEAREELERIKQDLENAIEMNGWVRINKITISVDRNVAQGQDGNGGNEHETTQVEIKNLDLFRQCMKLYIKELECKSGMLDDKNYSLKGIADWLDLFKIFKEYEIQPCGTGDYSVEFGKFKKNEIPNIRYILKKMGAKENE